jgi:hypothetical protein
MSQTRPSFLQTSAAAGALLALPPELVADALDFDASRVYDGGATLLSG